MLDGAGMKNLFFTENARLGWYKKKLLLLNILDGAGTKRLFSLKILVGHVYKKLH